MHDCPCCGEAVYSDDCDDLCSCCIQAGCEPRECGRATCDMEGVYDDCQIPECGDCGTRATFCTDGKWHSNCDKDECPDGAGKSWDP